MTTYKDGELTRTATDGQVYEYCKAYGGCMHPVDVDLHTGKVTDKQGNEVKPPKNNNQGGDPMLKMLAGFFIAIAIVLVVIWGNSFLNDKTKSDFLQNEISFRGSEKAEPPVTYLSDTIDIKYVGLELNQNPFTYKSGFKVINVEAKKEVREGCTDISVCMDFQVVFVLQNIKDAPITRTQTFPVTFKVIDKDDVRTLSGDATLIVYSAEPGEKVKAYATLFNCGIMYDDYKYIELTIDGAVYILKKKSIGITW